MYLTNFLFLLGYLVGFSFSETNTVNTRPFPKNFMFGVATAAFQIEGGWNADNKSESIWDNWCHNYPDRIADRSNGDVACDSYHKYKTDIELLKDLGVDHYRFSIAWTRILPSGFGNEINQAGVNYYMGILKLLKENKIKPVVTIYHWDLPQSIQQAGGWTNEIIVELFANYARTCFELFGNYVEYWITINEPTQMCLFGYGDDMFAPGANLSGITDYLCAHYVVKAHARAWHIYDEEFRPTQQGKVAITVDSFWAEPASDSIEDRTAAETELQFALGWYLHPIFFGDYPKVMKERIAKRSKLEGFLESRLPSFTQEEIEYTRGTHDYLGFNYYSSNLVKAIPEPEIGQPSWEKDTGVTTYQPDEWESTDGPGFRVTPWGFRKILRWLKDTYNDTSILVTENGMPISDFFADNRRISFIQSHLSYLLDAIVRDKVRVFGYTYWTLMDDFEWNSGYTLNFGLYYTNFSSPDRERKRRKSVQYYKRVIRTHRIGDSNVDDDDDDDDLNDTTKFDECQGHEDSNGKSEDTVDEEADQPEENWEDDN